MLTRIAASPKIVRVMFRPIIAFLGVARILPVIADASFCQSGVKVADCVDCTEEVSVFAALMVANI
jgi:hypothetical protein